MALITVFVSDFCAEPPSWSRVPDRLPWMDGARSNDACAWSKGPTCNQGRCV